MARAVDAHQRPQDKASAPPACVHWWMLPAPLGPTCEGVCKWCGARREFPNSYTWHREWQATGAAKMPPFVRKRL